MKNNINKNGIASLGGAFGDIDKGGYTYEYDARDALKPYLGSDVQVFGFIKKLSMTKGHTKRPSAFLIDVEIKVNGKTIEFEYLWLETEDFEAGQEYMFDAKIISYIAKRGKESHIKYTLGSMTNIKKLGDSSREKTLKDVEEKKKEETKIKKESDPSVAIEVIHEIMNEYGYVATPGIVPTGEWQCTISDINGKRSMIISTEESFAAAVTKARDIISFLAEKRS